jgi:hypothetical protein
MNLLAFLSDARSYPHRPRRLRVVETHASWLALAGRYVFKVKKPVNLGFLDFSTLEKRRHFCQREVALNRRLCPEVYLGVVPIVLRAGRLCFGGDGKVLEYAVKMRPLPERHFLLRRMARGEAGPRDVDAIVAVLAPFYKAHEPTPEIAAWGRVSRLRISTAENFRQTKPFLGETISRAAFEAIRAFTAVFYRRHAALFAARIRERRIRDCHGDLHLEHIHLGPERLTIYDCIEFNDRFRYIDIASDVAFLAMDFDFHERPDLARHFAARMARALGDPGMMRLLDFYKCYRAYVRGKVESLQEHGHRAHAARYFQLALRYAVCGTEPMALVVMGRVGSGKSTLARALGHELGCTVFSSDRIRKELAGIAPTERGTFATRRRLYSRAMSDRTYAALARHALVQLRQHHSVVVEATFGSRRRRDRFRRALARAGGACFFIEVQAPAASVRRRLAARAQSAEEISDARLEDLPRLDRAYEPPGELPAAQHVTVKTAGPREAVVIATMKKLAERHAAATGEGAFR